MRIGILTLPLHTNYGGILQAYALQTVLEKMGHEVVIFDTSTGNYVLPFWKKPLVYSKRIIKKYVLRDQDVVIFFEKKHRNNEVNKFIDNYLHRKKVSDFKILNSSDFDAIIVGSDQIWRPSYFNKSIQSAFLDFTNAWPIKRIAYAASFGTSEWEYSTKQTNDCSTLIKRFDAVSIREDVGVELCKKYFQVNAIQALDPTMLLSPSDYINLIKESDSDSGKYLAVYMLDPNEEKQQIVKKIAEHLGFDIVIINGKKYKSPISVSEWLYVFNHASYVVTDSFHGTVFSMLFNKQFVSIANDGRGLNRFTSLLKIFCLQQRLVYSIKEITDNLINSQIDYSRFNDILLKERVKSFQFLSNSLSE